MLKRILLSGMVISAVGAADYSVTSSTVDEWNSGFCKSIKVTNTSSQVLDWEVTLDEEGTLFTAWSAIYAQEGQKVTYRGKEDNVQLAPNQSTTFGYCATKPISQDSTLLTVSETVTADWGTGLCKNVTLYNSSGKRVEWSMNLSAEGEVLNLWNANYQQDANFTISATGLDYNRIIEPQKTITFGYCSTRVVKEKVISDLESVELDSDAITFDEIKGYNISADAVSKNLKLPTSGENGTTITWKSNVPSLISDDGILIHPKVAQSNQNVKLSATIVKGNESSTKEFDLEVVTSDLYSEFNLGFGGSYSYKFLSTNDNEKIWVSSIDLALDENFIYNGYYQKIKNFNTSSFQHIQSYLNKSKFFVYWVTKGWQVSWFDRTKIQKAMDAGYIPVFSYWYFGDGLVKGVPTELEIKEYAQDTIRFAAFLNALKGRFVVIMEPEFNKEGVTQTAETQIAFANVIADAIDTIKAKNPQALFSLSMMDKGNRAADKNYSSCGYENCALGDKGAWEKPSIIYNQLASRLDFISFQQNIAQFSRNPHNDSVAISYTKEDLGVDFFTQRVMNFSKFLKERYNKPVFMPFVSVATASWSDDNQDGEVENSEVNPQGWEEVAETIYYNLSQSKSALQESGLFGFAAMTLFDNPMQDINGYQFFLQNEYHLGLIGSISIDEIDDGIDGELIFKRNVFEYVFD